MKNKTKQRFGQINGSYKHGLRQTSFYSVWRNIKRRCLKIKDKQYKDYGGRGIKICDKWLDFRSFQNDMFPTYRKGLQINRINNNGNYEPSNCKWVTQKENCNNKNNNHLIEFNRQKLNLTQWSEKTGISFSALMYRIKAKWSVDKMLSTLSNDGKWEYKGERKTLREWANIYRINFNTLKAYVRGSNPRMSLEEAIERFKNKQIFCHSCHSPKLQFNK